MEAAASIRVKELALSISHADVARFHEDGFLLHPASIFLDDNQHSVQKLCSALEEVVNGVFDTGVAPSSRAALPPDLLCDGKLLFTQPSPPVKKGSKPRSTIHLINAWRSNTSIAQLVTSTELGAAVAKLMGWEAEGCRVAQDQVWIKPPGSGALSFHRDTPYLDFAPKAACTLWIPFDNIDRPNVGALEYCRGSHRWEGRRRGSAKHFYKPDYRALLRLAADDEQSARNQRSVGFAETVDVDVVRTHGCAGCCSFHNGNTWHGSGPNGTTGWRRGIGIHYIRGDAVFSDDCGKLWQQFRHPDGSNALPEEFFPVVARGTGETGITTANGQVLRESLSVPLG